MKSPSSFVLTIVSIVSLMFSCAVAAQEDDAARGDAAATAKVERMQSELIGVMREGEALGYAGRRDRLAPVFRETFDLPYVTRLLLGRYWRELSDDRKAQFEDMIFRYATGTFASRFTTYDGERFEVEFTRPLKNGNWRQVRSWFRMGDGESLRLDYAVRRSDDDWHIIDVYYDGVSGTRIQRNEFVEVIENDGMDALIEQLNEKIERLETQG